MKKKLPQRKINRLRGYDYSQNGAYFITICAHDKKSIFSEITDGKIFKLPFGEICKTVIEEIPPKYDVEITDYVIMPNHIHFIVLIQQSACYLPKNQPRSEISKIVGYLKMNVSKRIHEISPVSPVWQRNFHDHIIRNYDDYLKISEYIQNNPLKWKDDCFYTTN